MARSMLDERVEKDRVVRHGKIVVSELAVAVLRNRTEFGAQRLVGFVRRRAAVGDEAGELSRGIESERARFRCDRRGDAARPTRPGARDSPAAR